MPPLHTTSHHTRLAKVRVAITYLVLLAICIPVGTLWHEVIGHGAVGMLMGGRITYVEVLGVAIWPQLRWRGCPDGFGRCSVAGIPTKTRWHLHCLAGSLSTWCVSAIAGALLWVRRWRGLARVIMVCLSLWWFDVLTYTLPSWGLRRFIFWYRVPAEPYNAAVALGIPGPLFQAFAVGTSVCLVGALAARLVLDRRALR